MYILYICLLFDIRIYLVDFFKSLNSLHAVYVCNWLLRFNDMIIIMFAYANTMISEVKETAMRWQNIREMPGKPQWQTKTTAGAHQLAISFPEEYLFFVGIPLSTSCIPHPSTVYLFSPLSLLKNYWSRRNS